jgi:hypothetical protein
MTLRIKKAKEIDWKPVSDILTICTEWLTNQGRKFWAKAKYLNSKEFVIQRIEEKEVYLLFFEEEAIGTITLSYKSPSYYKSYTF